MKQTLYFPNKEAYDAYWGGNEPSSMYLCIIENNEGVDNVLITSSNNSPSNTTGKMEEMGTDAIAVISDNNEELTAAEAKTKEILEGEQN